MLAVRQHDAVLRLEAAARRHRGLGGTDDARTVVGMNDPLPLLAAEVAGVRRDAEERLGALVPDQPVGREIRVPDPDVRGGERELEPPGQPRELGFALADDRDLVVAQVQEPPDAENRQRDHQPGEREERALQPEPLRAAASRRAAPRRSPTSATAVRPRSGPDRRPGRRHRRRSGCRGSVRSISATSIGSEGSPIPAPRSSASSSIIRVTRPQNRRASRGAGEDRHPRHEGPLAVRADDRS